MNDILEQLKIFAITHDLPKTDMALFGTRCPYCGKTDRIRRLESPDELSNTLNSENLAIYLKFWDCLANADGSPGICKFCQNPLRIVKNGFAEPLV